MKKSFARKGNKTLFWWLLRRRHAVEQINHDATSSSCTSTSSSFITPSLEFPNRTSFVFRESEFEMDQILDDLANDAVAVEEEVGTKIKYDAASYCSSSAEDFSDSPSSFITPSLEFPNRTSFVFRESEFEIDQTLDDLAISFKINDHNVLAQDLSEAGPSGTRLRIGGGDGDMERAYRYLRISGPHDLAISYDAWEASKMRSSSDIIDRVKSFEFDDHKVKDLDLSEAGPSGVVVHDDTEFRTQMGMELVSAGMVENKRCMEQTSTILVKSKEYLVPNGVVAVGGGIKGVRPPLRKFPPSMKRPIIDLQGSSWDLTHKGTSFSSSSDKRSDEEEVESKIMYDAPSSGEDLYLGRIYYPFLAEGTTSGTRLIWLCV